MEPRIQFNVVDHYYYPDSDLETITEESSALDSEDDRRSISSRRSSSSTVTSSKFDEESRKSVKSQSSSSTLQGAARRAYYKSPPSSVDSHSNSSYVSYNGFSDNSYDVKGAVDPISHQKIVYAKCLPGSDSPPIIYGGPVHNGVQEQRGEFGTITDMFDAARQGNVTVLSKFSANELSNTVDEGGNTPLHAAAEHGRLGCLKKLVSHFPPHMVTLPNDDLMTATALAVKHNHLECVQWLLRHSSAGDELALSQRTSSIDGSTTRPPLIHVAARFDRCEILDWLCGEMSRDDISIDIADHCSNTPVHVAARYGHLRSIQTLVARGASVTALNSDGDTPGQAARRHGHDTTVGYLVVVETCVSLAQQLVALRHETEGLKVENEKLRKESESKNKSVPGNVTSANLLPKQAEETKRYEKEPLTTSNPDTSRSTDILNKRRVLQEQPPPPKLWDSPRKPEKVMAGRTAASIKGHTAIPPQKKISKPQDALQSKLDEVLNGPGTAVDGDVTMHLKVSDIEPPMTSAAKFSSNPTAAFSSSNDLPTRVTSNIFPVAATSSKITSTVTMTPHNPLENFKSPTIPPSVSSSANSSPNIKDARFLNNEVEAITKDIEPEVEKKPWEKLTMDEMLKRVRDIRFQPSPSISLCTEDSTMESVEMMRERMAAASRWFLVERGREKPKQSSSMPLNPASLLNEKTRLGHPISPPYQGYADSRKGPIKPVHPNMAKQPVQPNTTKQPDYSNAPKQPAQSNVLIKPVHTSVMKQSAHPNVTKQSNQRPNDTAKMQNAIQEHYHRTTNSNTQPIHVNGDVYRPPAQLHVNGEGHQPKIVNQTNKVPSGTLKFMVSHSKKTMKKPSPVQESISTQQATILTKQPMKKSSPIQELNPAQRIITPPKQEPKYKPTSSPKVVAPTSPPVVATTQRSNSYRRAVQVASGDHPVNSSPTSPSSGGSATDSDYDSAVVEAKKHTITSRKDLVTSERSTKSKKDPLKKRTGKETSQSMMWTPPQKPVAIYASGPIINNGATYNKAIIAQNREQKIPTSRYNQWTVPRNNKLLNSPATYPGFDDDNGGFDVSEVPELKAEIPSRQSSFLRRVQGKLK